jgi:hypothetical protein
LKDLFTNLNSDLKWLSINKTIFLWNHNGEQ